MKALTWWGMTGIEGDLYLVSSGTMTKDGQKYQRNHEGAASPTVESSVARLPTLRPLLWGQWRRCPPAGGTVKKEETPVRCSIRIRTLGGSNTKGSQVRRPAQTHPPTPKGGGTTLKQTPPKATGDQPGHAKSAGTTLTHQTHLG